MTGEHPKNETAKTSKAFLPWVWIPLAALILGFVLFFALLFFETNALLFGLGLVLAALLYFFVQSMGRLILRQWKPAATALIRLVLLALGVYVLGSALLTFVVFGQLFGPSEDHFADNLIIPDGIDIAVPEDGEYSFFPDNPSGTPDAFQASVRAALAVPGTGDTEFIPALPSLRRAAAENAGAFRDYLDASPDWHVFMESGHRFAARRWSYGGIPRDELHGYISGHARSGDFSIRCLLCLDCKQWSYYDVQRVPEGTIPAHPRMTRDNEQYESRVMIDCGKVWVELFDQSATPERRITKVTIAELEKEFALFLENPKAAVREAKARSSELAGRIKNQDKPALTLYNGMQPGIYVACYALNPGAPGSVYLKAFEVTQGTPLSVQRLRYSSETRMAWSENPEERFSASAGFTIYEGDWGKPYAARFEVWFKPDDGSPERKLAERIFKIEGWQR